MKVCGAAAFPLETRSDARAVMQGPKRNLLGLRISDHTCPPCPTLPVYRPYEWTIEACTGTECGASEEAVPDSIHEWAIIIR